MNWHARERWTKAAPITLWTRSLHLLQVRESIPIPSNIKPNHWTYELSHSCVRNPQKILPQRRKTTPWVSQPKTCRGSFRTCYHGWEIYPNAQLARGICRIGNTDQTIAYVRNQCDITWDCFELLRPMLLMLCLCTSGYSLRAKQQGTIGPMCQLFRLSTTGQLSNQFCAHQNCFEAL